MDPFFIQAMWGFIIIALVAMNFFSAQLGEWRRLKSARLEQQSTDRFS